MKITGISIYRIELPLRVPYSYSGGRLLVESLDSTFVRIDTDAGLVGWGEGCPWGDAYLPAHAQGIRAGIERLAPALIGEDPRAVTHINRLMDLRLPGHASAKSPLDMACWDILGQSAGMPLWMLLGGSVADGVHVNSSISTGTPSEMIARIEEARALGYRTHSAKLGGGNPQEDIERIEAIGAAKRSSENITYDINRAWTPSVALQVLNSVADASSWIEQPCETLEQCAYVADKVRQPVLLDECLHDFGDHLRAWKLDACVGLKIKPNRLGGLTRCLQARDFAISVGWKMHIEDTGGSALADTAAIHLASATPQENRMDSWLCHYHLTLDPVAGQGARNVDGIATPPSIPGLGVIPDSSLLGDPIRIYE